MKRVLLNRNFGVSFQYFTDTGKGVIPSTSTNIRVHQTSMGGIEDQSYDQLVNLTHKNLLRCFLINPQYQEVVYSDFTCTFDRWVADLRTKEVNPVMPFRYPNADASPENVTIYIPDVYKLAIRSLIKVVSFLHDNDYCTTGFDESNIVFQGNGLRLCRIRFVLKNPQGVSADYLCIHDLVKRLFAEVTSIPHDMKNLMDLLFAGDYRKRNLIANHIAILTHEERCFFIRKCSEMRDVFSFDDISYRGAVKLLGNQTGWKARLSARDGPMYKAFVYQATDSEEMSYVDNYATHESINLSLLKCWRNLEAHICKQAKKHPYSALRIVFGAQATELMIMNAFGDLITKFQDCLHQKDILHLFLLVQEEP